MSDKALIKAIEVIEKAVQQANATSANIKETSKEPKTASEFTNARRKELYSKLELVLLEYESDSTVCDGEGGLLDQSLGSRVETLRKSLKLQSIKRPRRWWYWIDIIYRFCGVCCGFFTISVILSLPILALQIVDDIIGSDPFNRISDKLRKFCGNFILLLSGIVYDVYGLDHSSFDAPCVLLAFTHACNLDGLLISATCPVRHYALAKKELFFVPFFSWISFAIGGVPVDRQNRDRAIGALRRCSERALAAKSCIAVGPEGTRSTTGNLLSYKKGPFHIQSQLGAPIVPLIIYGGFDLYPVGSWVNQCGRVALRYLPPIVSDDASDKDAMRRLCRKRVLEALADTPAACGEDLTPAQWLSCYVANLCNFVFICLFLKLSGRFCFEILHWSVQETMWYTTAGIFTITIGLFVYFTYVVDIIDRMRIGSKGSRNGSEKTD